MADIQDLNPEFQSRLIAMVNASGGRLTINSGYRSVAEQTALWNASDKTGRTVAFPGQSMHNRGLAADLGGDLDWAHQHAAEFGLYWPMPWEPWHVQPIGLDGKSGDVTAANTAAPPQPKNDMAHGLNVIAEALSGHPGAAPTVQDPMKTPDTQTQSPDQTQPQGQQGVAVSGDLNAQLKAGFERAGRSDLAAMVGSPAFEAWINAESGGNPEEVSPANNQGKPNGGIFQFWAGHDWAQPYFQGNRFTMSPEDQAYYAATKFNLTPQRIQAFASEIQSGNYPGWG